MQKQDRKKPSFGAKVDNFNQILSTPNSDCEAHLESLAVENREYDLYIWLNYRQRVFNWIANVSFCSRTS